MDYNPPRGTFSPTQGSALESDSDLSNQTPDDIENLFEKETDLEAEYTMPNSVPVSEAWMMTLCWSCSQ